MDARWIVALALSAGMALAQDVPALARQLQHDDPRVREKAVAELAVKGATDPEAVKLLVKSLDHPDPYLRGAAALALGRVGRAAVPALVEALGSDKVMVRESAVIALGRMGGESPEVLSALVRALEDPSAYVRFGAAMALAEQKGDAAPALGPLTRCLGDVQEEVRRAASQALRRLDPSGRARPATAQAVIEQVERWVPRLLAEHHVPGLAIALIQDRRVIWSKGFGVTSVDSKEAVTPETVFEAASMSKPIFAMLAMQQVDLGRLELDHPLETPAGERLRPVLPERRGITARMLLSHTSGLPNWRPGGEEREGPIPQRFAPGQGFTYSGEGIFHLQRHLEREVGLPLEAWAEKALFAPLNLRHTGYGWTPERARKMARGHGENGAALPPSPYLHPNAAYTLYTTVEDYARLVVEMLKAERGQSKLLSQTSAREMLKGQVKVDAREPLERPGAAQGRAVQWGLGWSLNETDLGLIAHHSGANQTGFRCFSQFSPSRGTGLVILTNGLGGGELWTRLVAVIGDF